MPENLLLFWIAEQADKEISNTFNNSSPESCIGTLKALKFGLILINIIFWGWFIKSCL